MDKLDPKIVVLIADLAEALMFAIPHPAHADAIEKLVDQAVALVQAHS